MARTLACILVAAAIALAVAVFVAVAGAGIFWLYLFGDDPWPGWAEPALVALALTAGALSGVATFAGLRRFSVPGRIT